MLSTVGDFARGFRAAWFGLGALATPGLKRYVVLPVLVSAATLAAIIAVAVEGFGRLLDWLQSWLPAWLAWLEWLLWPLFLIAILLLAVYAFTLVANLLGAPFNGLLAEKYEVLLSDGAAASAGVNPLLAIAHELRKLLYVLRWLLLAGVLFLVPGLNLFAPALWLLLGAWLLALEYLAYPMDNHALAPAAQRGRLRSRRMLTLGFGAGIMLMSSVPLLNLLAMPAGVLGATRLWFRELGVSAPRTRSGPDSG